MKCTESKKAIQEILDGKTINDKEVINHIKSCSNCLKEYEATKVLKNLLSFKEEIKIPADFNARVWKKIETPKLTVFEIFFGKAFDTSFVFKTAAVAVAIVFMVIAVKNSTVKKDITAAVKKPALIQQAKIKTINIKSNFHCANKIIIKKEEAKVIEIAAVPSVVPKTAVENNSIINETREKGPEVAPNKITIAFENKGATAAEKQPENSNQVNAASIHKEPVPEKITSCVKKMEGPVEIKNNVFNPSRNEAMNIKYEVKEMSKVIIKVYNKKGEDVKTVINEVKAAGTYETLWNGTDNTGALVGAAMYIVYIKTDLAEKKIKAAVVK